MSDQAYPIAEIFATIQGEATFAGTPMTLIRLAGCNVGKPYTYEARQALGLAMYQERCTAWDGESFCCDTNYRKSMVLTTSQIMAMPEVQSAMRVSITGGEPLIHNLYSLVAALHAAGKRVHMETSGTLPIPTFMVYKKEPVKVIQGNHAAEDLQGRVWITCSPKANYLIEVLHTANEIKVLVDAHTFNEELFEYEFGVLFRSGRLWVSPVNGEKDLNHENLVRCMKICDKHRGIRLTVQLHKIIGVR